MRVTHRSNSWIWTVTVAVLLIGCGDGEEPDAGPGDAGVPPTDASQDAAIDASDASTDSGTLPPIPEGAPGGPRSAAPVVGCEDAERPARRDESSVEVCEAEAPGRCWYISPEGEDTNDGSFGAPFGTPQAAVRQAGPGDIIYLRGGVYGDDNAHPRSAVSWDDESRGTRRGFISAQRISLPGWVGSPSYTVASGTAEAPITVRSFPGERACASGAGSITLGWGGEDGVDNAYWRIENITVKGAPIGVGGGAGDGADPRNQVHDIVIQGNEVYDYTTGGGDNPGLVRVNRGDGGGPYRITVESNILHDLSSIDPDGVTRDWSTAMDAQHFGAVTTLSCETYRGLACGGNGEITIENNHIYRVPQAFFFKNPAAGPVIIRGNVIHQVGSLGKWSPSNILLENNLIYGGGGGARLGGTGGPVEDEIFDRVGHNLVLRNNTFIGFDTLVEFRNYASGHTIRGNVVQGLTLSMSERSWNNMGYVYEAQGWIRPDPTAEITASRLAMGNDFDDNCFVTGVADFIAYGRRYDPGTGTELTHLSLADARSTLSFELSSDVVSSPAEAFVDFDAGDYRVSSSGGCAGRGATVPDWAPSLP